MGKTETAAAQLLASQHGFSIQTLANEIEVQEVLAAAARGAGTGGMKGTILRTELTSVPGGFNSFWEGRGPGGLVQVLTFAVVFREASAQSNAVAMQLKTFKYQGSGRRVTLNMGSTIRAFRDICVAELRASPTSLAAGQARPASPQGPSWGPPPHTSRPEVVTPTPTSAPPLANPARWSPDPMSRNELRYWDGDRWTQHVSNQGVVGVDSVS